MRAWMAGAAVTAALAAVPAAAAAADEVIATTAKATGVEAYRGHVVWSAWDPAISAYRLTEYHDGMIQPLNRVPPSAVPFDVDLGPDPFGGTMAVFSRCKKPPLSLWALNGRRGCDLYYARLSAGSQVTLRRANSPADESSPTVWNGRIAFARTYSGHGGPPRRFLYWRSFTGSGPSHRLRRGPVGDGAVPEQLDMRGTRVTYVWQYEFGAQLRLADTGGGGRALVRVPGSGAAAHDLVTQGPTLAPRGVYWMLAVTDGEPVSSEFRWAGLGGRSQQRATTGVTADPGLERATEGFAQDGGASYYVRAVAADRFEIHRVTGLAWEPAPPIELD
jgi:hypothetical protein